MNIAALNSLCYTAGWFWCVLLGIRQQSLLALVGAIILIFIQLYNTKKNDFIVYLQDIFLLVFSTFLGLCLELIFLYTGLINYAGGYKFFPPIWILCLYPLFSLLINHSLSWMKKNYFFPFLLGFMLAPFSYFAGRSLGGLVFNYSPVISWISLGLSWGLFLCLLVYLAKVIKKATIETILDRDSKENIEMLFDSDCPLCSKEICYLKKHAEGKAVKFTAISAYDFKGAPLNHETAMSQMHALDSKGNMLVGVAAFAAVYARSNKLLVSTLLRMPFILFFMNPLYRLFAKHRLWITGRK